MIGSKQDQSTVQKKVRNSFIAALKVFVEER